VVSGDDQTSSSRTAEAGETSYPVKVYRVNRSAGRTSFQCAAPYSTEIDIRSDIAIAYGINDSLSSRIAIWVQRGYIPHAMTGAAWGEYEEYVNGEFDGRPHIDEGQVDSSGTMIMHHGGVPYMVPTPSYTAYLMSLARQAVDAGARALYYEEPEFWARAGYSEAFQKLWKAEYGDDWQRPDSSPNAYWRCARLKYLIYKRTLERVFSYAKEYARRNKAAIQCYVPTHSLINYAHWRIVSPESSLMDIESCDGYVAQVWTGTARTPNVYRGRLMERTFETAYLEFSSMVNMVQPGGKRLTMLADPVEDNPSHTWKDYRRNYEKVLVASLLFPRVSSFEVMPWPDRVFTGKYPGSHSTSGSRVGIPAEYAAVLMNVANSLNDMDQGVVRWECGSNDVGVLVSDTMMFQRGGPWSSDEHLSGFFGMALPLLKRGIPAQCVVLEQIAEPRALKQVRVLLASYEHMKPQTPNANMALAEWVRRGGTLVYLGDDSDPFHNVREWWNSNDNATSTPREDLFARLRLPRGVAPGIYRVGEGWLAYSTLRPDRLAHAPDGDAVLWDLVQSVVETQAKRLSTRNYIVLHRGPYTAGAVVDESESSEPLRLRGTFADLLTSGLAIRRNPTFAPGEVFLLRRMGKPKNTGLPVVIGGTSRVESVDLVSSETVRIVATGPSSVPQGLLRIQMQFQPTSVEVEGHPGEASYDWSRDTRSLLVRFRNRPGGTNLILRRNQATGLPSF
jgi:hypothetical protein